MQEEKEKIQKIQGLKKIRKEKDQKNPFWECGICMIGWVKDPKSQRLGRSEPDSNLEPELEPKPKIELRVMVQARFLSDIFYPPRIALPCCFTLLDLGPNVTFELNPHYT